MSNNTVNINTQNDTVTVEKDVLANSVSVTNSNTTVNVTAPSNTVTLDGATSANTVTINSQNDIIKLLSITEPKGDTVTITEPETKVVTVTTPGPPGPPLASITETDSLVSFDRPLSGIQINGDLTVDQYIIHKDDANTFINFTDDRIRFEVGGISYLDLNDASSAPHDITFNRGNNNVDLNIQGGSDGNLFFTDASTDRIGIGTNTPSYKLDVNGDIRVTGGLVVDSNINNSSIHATNILLTNAVKYTDSGGDARFAIQFDNDVVALSNRASNGKVQIRANTSTAGSSGEVTVAEFEDTIATFNTNISSSANITSNIVNVKTRVKAIDSTLEFSGDTLDFVDASSLSRLFKGTVNGAFEAYHAGVKKFETTSNGANITGNVTGSGNLKIDGSVIDFSNLPTSDPGVAGRLYNDSNTLKISAG